MRLRERTTIQSARGSNGGYVIKQDRTGGEPWFPQIHSVSNHAVAHDSYTIDDETTTIIDDPTPLSMSRPYQDYQVRDSLFANKKAIRAAISSDPLIDSISKEYGSKLQRLLLPPAQIGSVPRPVKKCEHYGQRLVLPEAQTCIFSTSQPFFDGTNTHSVATSFDPVTNWYHLRPGSLTPSQTFESAENETSDGDFVGVDWFGLVDQFQEACDSFMSGGFFLGEFLWESGIFADALKLVISPSKAIKTFIGLIQPDRALRNRTLGAIRHQLHGASDGILLYNFAVKPAIGDLVKTLTAHMHVQARLNYLLNNRGRYAPIRVRRSFPSSIVDLGLTRTPGHYYKRTIWKDSFACLFGMGRVRDDIRWNDTWSAYLQYFNIHKMAGLAWELIPFSFVADWFTNAQERVNINSRLRAGAPFSEISAIGHSIKTTLEEELILAPPETSTWGMPMTSPEEGVKLFKRETFHYQRHPGIPDTSGFVDQTYLDPRQVLYSLALVGQRL